MNDGEDDQVLMQRYQRGDTGAFERLYGRHKGPLYRYCLRQSRNPDTAAELFQEVWARIIKGRAGYQPLARFTTWLYQVAHNTWIDQLRRAGRRPTLVSDTGVAGAAHEAVAAASDSPPAQAQAGELMARVLAAIEALPAEQREVFLLKEETDLTIEEIGQATGVSRETAKSRLRYAIKKLRADLESCLPDAGAIEQADGSSRGLAGDTP